MAFFKEMNISATMLPEKFRDGTPVEEIREDLFTSKNVRLFLKRDDLLHPDISGNKWRKLALNIALVRKGNYDRIITCGGAYSNHIYAVAAAGRMYGFKTTGIIRGEPVEPLNPTLNSAKKNGMELLYVSRKAYRDKDDRTVVADLRRKHGRVYLIPEGGSSAEGIKGCISIPLEINMKYDYLTVCCGTGGTLAGMVIGAGEKKRLIGFPVLKGGSYLESVISKMIRPYDPVVPGNWHLETGYHFGGYAKYTLELIGFINAFKKRHRVDLDPVYTGKMMYGLYDMIEKDRFKPGSVIVAVHTGGLQGIDGFNQRYGKLIT